MEERNSSTENNFDQIEEYRTELEGGFWTEFLRISALVISNVLNPLLIPTYLFLLFFRLLFEYNPLPTPGMVNRFLLFVFITTAIMPGIGVFILHKLGQIKTMNLFHRSDRTKPLLLSLFCYLSGLAVLYNQNISNTSPLIFIYMGMGLTVLAVLIVTQFYKISIHTTCVGGLLGFVLGLALLFRDQIHPIPVSIVLLAVSSVVWARLYLNAHTPTQAWIGIGLGSLVGLAMVGAYSFVI